MPEAICKNYESSKLPENNSTYNQNIFFFFETYRKKQRKIDAYDSEESKKVYLPQVEVRHSFDSAILPSFNALYFSYRSDFT